LAQARLRHCLHLLGKPSSIVAAMGGVCVSSESSKTAVEDVNQQSTLADGKTDAKPEDQPEAKQEAEQEAQPETQPEAAAVPKVTIAIVGARGLRNADWMPGSGKSDCFCTVSLLGKEEELYKTKVMNNTLTPVWNEETEVEVATGESLEFRVYDADVASRDFLGKVKLDSASFEKSGFNGELELEEAGKDQAYLKLKVKMPGQEEFPKGPPTEITCKVDRETPTQSLGLDIDTADGVYEFVTLVKDGPFLKYNQTVKAADQVMAGDFIVKVNGVEGSSKALLEEFKKAASSVEVVIRRPQELRAAIEKPKASTALGLEFPKKLAGEALLITKVGAGPFQEWNEKNPGHEVCNGDRIVAVGDFRGKATELQKKMQTLTKFQVTIVRPASAQSSWWFW